MGMSLLDQTILTILGNEMLEAQKVFELYYICLDQSVQCERVLCQVRGDEMLYAFAV